MQIQNEGETGEEREERESSSKNLIIALHFSENLQNIYILQHRETFIPFLQILYCIELDSFYWIIHFLQRLLYKTLFLQLLYCIELSIV